MEIEVSTDDDVMVSIINAHWARLVYVNYRHSTFRIDPGSSLPNKDVFTQLAYVSD